MRAMRRRRFYNVSKEPINMGTWANTVWNFTIPGPNNAQPFKTSGSPTLGPKAGYICDRPIEFKFEDQWCLRRKLLGRGVRCKTAPVVFSKKAGKQRVVGPIINFNAYGALNSYMVVVDIIRTW